MSSGLAPFSSAIAHSRRKTMLKELVKDIDFAAFTQTTFGEVYAEVDTRYGSTEGIGRLTVYDIAVAVCRNNGVPIQKVYLLGNGPRRAAKKLYLTPYHTKYETVKNGKRLPYIEVDEAIDALQVHGCKVDIGNESPHFVGDAVESFLCNWQKTA